MTLKPHHVLFFRLFVIYIVSFSSRPVLVVMVIQMLKEERLMGEHQDRPRDRRLCCLYI